MWVTNRWILNPSPVARSFFFRLRSQRKISDSPRSWHLRIQHFQLLPAQRRTQSRAQWCIKDWDPKFNLHGLQLPFSFSTIFEQTSTFGLQKKASRCLFERYYASLHPAVTSLMAAFKLGTTVPLLGFGIIFLANRVIGWGAEECQLTKTTSGDSRKVSNLQWRWLRGTPCFCDDTRRFRGSSS